MLFYCMGIHMKRLIVFFIMTAFLPVSLSFADDATVLPKGRFRLAVQGLISLPITERFDTDGNTEDLATDFNVNLNNEIFDDLSLVEAAFGLPGGSATFGRSVVDFERHIQIYEFQAAYGITNRLSVGLIVPYWIQKIDVKAELDNSTATVGVNPAVPGNVAPLGVPGTRLPTTEDVQTFLESQGFRRVEDWSDKTFGDMFGGIKYQYYQSAHWRLAATGTVRFPTGKWDDPNNLVDNDTGFDAWGLGIQLHQDFVWQQAGLEKNAGLLTPGAFSINTTFRYEAILPDQKPFRVCNIHRTICPDFDPKVDRNVGDIIQAEISGSVGLFVTGLTLTPIYTYSHKFKDNFSGDLGFDYDQLRVETDYHSHVLDVRLSYSTLDLFLKKQFPLPLSVSFRYWDRLLGNNNQFNSTYLGFTLAAFF